VRYKSASTTTITDAALPRGEPDFDFKFTIADCSIISGTGRMRGRDLSTIRNWAAHHRDMLQLNWQLARDSEPLRDIED
jgi:hypothetical protein